MCPVALALALASLASCGARAPSVEERIDAAVARGVAFIVTQQASDGAWRSQTYGALKDGWALTATSTKALSFVQGDPASARALERGLAMLAGAARPDGTIDPGETGLPYPVYTASLAVIALTRADVAGPPRFAAARDAWLGVLEDHQLDEHLGWSPDDPLYGGWGYSVVPRHKSDAGEAFDADLSSTLFALGALRLAGRGADDAAVQRALTFVTRCQNLPLEGEPADPERDDGGFFMTPCNAFQNKAGGTRTSEGSGRSRSTSYGSMTADGLRALLRCGLPHDHPRVQAALAWIARRFDPATNPGDFEPGREVERDAAWYYASWSTAHALFELGVRELETPRGRVNWAEPLANEVLARQSADGAWRNRFTMVKEDDPLIATPFALAALSLARVSMSQAPH